VVLYDICFSYLDEAEKNLKEKDFDVYKEAIRKADAVIGELQAALNFQYELSPQLYPLYSYCRGGADAQYVSAERRRHCPCKKSSERFVSGFLRGRKAGYLRTLNAQYPAGICGYDVWKRQLNENFQESDTSRGFLRIRILCFLFKRSQQKFKF